MEHSNGPYGENVYWGSDTSFSPFHCAEAWVDEKKLYNYETNSCNPGQDCGHYTQIVWKNTLKVGCGKTVCVSGKGVFMVCEYDPPGNYVGERPY
ncbi:hypothetical protein Leryth_001210 [Lithospermum erythrorhizon]|nr:hypothetical protein Leryth_001210 [Lithospermum erythrorhizon]